MTLFINEIKLRKTGQPDAFLYIIEMQKKIF